VLAFVVDECVSKQTLNLLSGPFILGAEVKATCTKFGKMYLKKAEEKIKAKGES